MTGMKTFTTFLLGLFLTFCSDQPTLLEQIKRGGKLKVITFDSLTTVYQGPSGPTGVEYDLAKRFAEELGVELVIVKAGTQRDVLSELIRHRGHLAAAALMITPERKRRIRFGPSYQEVAQQVVYRNTTRKPRGLKDLGGRHIELVSDSPEAHYLSSIAGSHPGLEWHDNREANHRELLSLVWERMVDFTIASSNEIVLTRRFYPELRVAFDIGAPHSLAWAFPLDTDDSLYVATIHFFNKIRRSGELDQLLDRHYGHLESFDYVGLRHLMLHTHQRLPKYQAIFQQAALENQLDWRLLAAIGYQESHWDPEAVSPTGVRGIMMLTQGTARQMGVQERVDPRQSILGGARYFTRVKNKIPARIREPDRTWFALASYNIGFGHLEDARKLTDRRGGDPDKWIDVKQQLPLLSREEWYKKTRHGYARGHEAVNYVDNIRHYFDMLVWFETRDAEPDPEPPPVEVSSPVL